MQVRKVKISGVNTYQLPVLSNERMRELFQQLRQGKKAARLELINGNLRLVLSVLQRFKNRGENLDDLFQVGCIGLMKAIDNFPGHNVHFSLCCAMIVVRSSATCGTIRCVSCSLKMLAQSPACAGRADEAPLREPAIQEIAQEPAVTPEEVVLPIRPLMSLFHMIGLSDTTDPVYIIDIVSDQPMC